VLCSELVSSPLVVKPSVWIRRTWLSCVLPVKGYVTYRLAGFRPSGSCQLTWYFIEQSERVVAPRLTPPLPSESLASLGPHLMAPEPTRQPRLFHGRSTLLRQAGRCRCSRLLQPVPLPQCVMRAVLQTARPNWLAFPVDTSDTVVARAKARKMSIPRRRAPGLSGAKTAPGEHRANQP
jgi:hypothetical protein